MSASTTRISVVIPCYNQGRFLGEAIASVIGQAYANCEIIVVDDGSTDNTADVAQQYREAIYVRQPNSSMGAARNRGAQSSSGDYLVFLDADDYLLPDALQIGAGCLDERPACGLAYGLCRAVGAKGETLSHQQTPRRIAHDHYAEMLRRNFIWHPAAMICRRSVFDAVAGFNVSLRHCADTDFYLRVARRFPLYGHNLIVSAYRQHGGNDSRDSRGMLRDKLAVLRAQSDYVKGKREYERAYRDGIRICQDAYGNLTFDSLVSNAKSPRRWGQAARDLSSLLRHSPRCAVERAGQRLLASL